ncbi:hypothetical protein AB0912_21625 [Streptomyces sp. NPDC007084]|uniref:hypothetical protein n=1 Tax=Streptomyces sp. NPDC007084 TaxID=3154313 RepID=UPI00345111BB
MELSRPLGHPGDARRTAREVAAPQAAGLDAARVAEAPGLGSPTITDHPATRTHHTKKTGAAIPNLHSRTPARVARTAAGRAAGWAAAPDRRLDRTPRPAPVPRTPTRKAVPA